MKIIDNLIGLYELGHGVGRLTSLIVNAREGFTTPQHLGLAAGILRATLEHLCKDEILPFGQTKTSAVELRDLIDQIWLGRNASVPFSAAEIEMLKSAMDNLAHNLRHELNELPIFLATKRAAYDVRILLQAAENILNDNHVPLLSDKTLFDVREAGICIAFNVPTAAGFHSVRAVEAVARGYHEVITGVRPGAETPLGPLINNLRNERDARLAAKTIDKEDPLNLAIDFLARINNIYRKPISHPDMVLDLPTAMTVFDTMKCAITLIFDDSPKKRSAPIPPKFF